MLAQGQERGYICLHLAQSKVLTNGTGDGGPMINNKGKNDPYSCFSPEMTGSFILYYTTIT